VAEQPRHSRRLHVLWAICISTLAALALFCWLVVVPVWQTRSAVYTIIDQTQPFGGSGTGPSYVAAELQEGIRKLGGPRKAARRIGDFLAMPLWLRRSSGRTVEDWTLLRLLERCGPEGVAGLVTMSKNGCCFPVRHEAVEILGRLGPQARPAVPELRELLKHEDKDLRQTAADALKKIKAAQEEQKR
jgi:HEAT repeats